VSNEDAGGMDMDFSKRSDSEEGWRNQQVQWKFFALEDT